MAVLERSSSPAAAAAVAALITLASVAGVAGEVFFQEKFDGKHTNLTRLFVVSGSPVLLSGGSSKNRLGVPVLDLRQCACIAVCWFVERCRCGCCCLFVVSFVLERVRVRGSRARAARDL